MKINREYKMVCRKCNENFIADHLNRKYCSEKCKRDMFRKKQEDKRDNINKELLALNSNNNLLKNIKSKGISEITKEDLIKSGFKENVYIKRFRYNNKWFVLLDHFLLEPLTENKYCIHQY
jgi:hypothetical protein